MCLSHWWNITPLAQRGKIWRAEGSANQCHLTHLIVPIITVSKSKHQLFLNFSFCTLPTPVLAILLRTLAPEGIGLHQLLSCHFHLPSKQALKMETLNKLTQSLHKPGEKQTHCFFLNTMTFRKSPGCFCFLGLIIEVRNTGTAAVSMTKLLSQINKQWIIHNRCCSA